jgi:hypothetical protein
MSKETQTRIRDWAKRLQVSEQTIAERYAEQLKSLTVQYPTMKPDVAETRARALLYVAIKGELLSTATPFVGMVLGADSIRDLSPMLQRAGLEAWKASPEKAVQDGLCDSQGTPLDTRKMLGTVQNRNFGKPIPANILVRQVVAVMSPKDKKEFKPMRINVSGKATQEEIPIGIPISCRLNQRPSDDPKQYNANAATVTKWVPSDVPGLGDPFTVIDQYLGSWYHPLGDLEQFCKDTAKDNRRVVLTEGTAVRDPIGPTSIKSYIVIVDDESLLGDKGQVSQGIPVFCPEHLGPTLDFGQGSTIQILGRPRLGPSYNRETKQQDKSVLRPVLDAYGIFCRPEFKNPRSDSGGYSAPPASEEVQ